MNIVNRVQLTGNLGSKPEVRTFDSGDRIGRFSLATNEKYANRNGEEVTDTQWHNVVIKGKTLSKVIDELDKGTYVSVEGRLTTRSYTDKEGMKRYVTEVVATDIVIHHHKNDNSNGNGQG